MKRYAFHIFLVIAAMLTGYNAGLELGESSYDRLHMKAVHNKVVIAAVEAAAVNYSTVDSPRDKRGEPLIPMATLDAEYREPRFTEY